MSNQYTPIVFTNTGAKRCSLDGHPGVSYVDANGSQVGPSAVRNGDPTPTVILASGAQASARIDYIDSALYDNCTPAPTKGIKIYPPDETNSLVIPHDSSMCTGPINGQQLSIDVVRPGATGLG